MMLGNLGIAFSDVVVDGPGPPGASRSHEFSEACGGEGQRQSAAHGRFTIIQQKA